MLKLFPAAVPFETQKPAAFRRLCVETKILYLINFKDLPAAFRRLCVETNLDPPC